MAGYIRQSSFVDGDTITAALFNDEYNQLVNAFSNTDGHKHDGTTAEGPVIGLIGDAGETSPNNKVLIDTTNNYIEFYVEVSSAPVQQLYITDGAIVPVTDNDIDLGTSSLEFKNLYLDGTAKIDTLTVDEAATVGTTLGVTGATTLSSTLGVTGATTLSSTLAVTGATTLSSTLAVTGTSTLTGNVTTTNDLSVGGNLTVTGNATISGNLTFGDADTDTITIGADVASNITPDVDDTYDLGTSTKEWRNLYIDGTANIDSLVADTADINAGTIDNTAIGGTTASSGAFTTITASGATTLNGNVTLGDAATDNVVFNADVNSSIIPNTDDTYDLGSVSQEWRNLYVDGTANVDTLVIGTSTGVTSVDTDLTSVSASDDTLASAKAIKTYVDSQVTAQDLDFQGDSGGALSIDLDSETLTIAGGTGIDTTGATNTLTVAIDSTVATLTGTQTLTNKTLTSPDVNTPDIDGGTIDGTVIGGTTTAAGSFTTLQADTSLNVDGTATVDGLDVNNLKIEADVTATPTNDGANYIFRASGTHPDYAAGDLIIQARSSLSRSIYMLSGTTTPVNRLQINGDGDISFYEATGTTAKLFWDASAESLGIGTSSPANELHVVGDVKIEDASPVITLLDTTDSSTHLLQSINSTLNVQAQSILRFTTNAAEAMRITSTGRVGIGDTSPDAELHVNGGTDNVVALLESTDATTKLGLKDSSTTNIYSVAIGAEGDEMTLSSGSGGAEAIRIDSSGNVGIGTTSPARALHVSSGTTNGNSLFESTDSECYLYIKDSNTTSATTNYIGAVGDNLVLSSNVGIGTSSPQVRLSVDNSATGGEALRIGDTSGAGGTIGETYLGFTAYSSGTTQTYPHAWIGVLEYDTSDQKGILTFGTRQSNADVAPTEAMRIDSSGFVGIGTSSPIRELEVTGSGNVYIKVTAPTATDSAGLELANTGATWLIQNDDTSSEALTFDRAGTEVMRIDNSGNLLVGKTNTTLGTVGIENRADGRITSTRSGNTNLVLNRLTSDGSIVDFYKDGSAVGSISATGGDITVGTGNTGIRFVDATTSIQPINTSTGARVDDTILLGASAYRFKDLYLSNNINLANATTSSFMQVSSNVLQFGTSSADPIAFYANNAEAMRIDSSGNVGIGTSSFPSWSGDLLKIGSRTLYGQLNANSASYISNNLAYDGTNWKYVESSTGSLYAQDPSSPNAHRWYQAASGTAGANATLLERMRIDSSGNLLVGRTGHSGYGVANFEGGIDVTTNPIYARGGGIYIGGVAAANLLDDYEEGTFTPVFADASTGGNTASTTPTGYYTKVGNKVTLWMQLYNIDTSGLTTTNNIYIRGFPFQSDSVISIGTILTNRFTTNDKPYVVMCTAGTSHAVISYQPTGNTNQQEMLVSAVVSTASDIVGITLTYRTA